MLGKTIDQYQLIEFARRSDTAVVYKGFQPAMNRYVLVRVLSPAASRDPGAIEAFRQAAERTAQLEHPHILPVYDYGEAEGMAYVVTRFAEGGALSENLSRFQALPIAIRLVQKAANALEYIHGRGFVHGNLKPSTILLDEANRPLLADIGFGRSDTAGNVYMSPEQAQGGSADRRSDVYALGVLLYELLVGAPPAAGTLPSPRRQRPDLPAAVEKVILKAMAQYPEQRFQSAAEFRHALENALVAQQVTPTPLPDRPPMAQAQPVYRPQPDVVNIPTPQTQDTRRESWRAVLILLMLVLLALLVYLIFFRDGAAEAIPTPAPGTPGLTARTNVNVRSGPGEVYEAIGLLRQGQTAEIIGVSPDGQWWVIRFPAVPGGQGWVSAGFVDAINIENIPVVQPPPLPTLVPSPVPSSTTAAPSPPPTATQALPTATEPLPTPTEPLPTPTEAVPTATEPPPAATETPVTN